MLTSDGRLSMVVPNRLYRNRYGATLRKLLATRTDLLTLVDFGSTLPFVGTSAYVGCVVARRRASDAIPPDRVRVLQVKSLRPEFMAALLIDAERAATDINTEFVSSFWAQHPSATELPWALLSADERRSRVLIEESSERLDTIASVSQGIRTGANDLFIFDEISPDETGMCRAANGLGESAVLETALLEPVAHGSEVQRYQIVEPTKRLLYPYRQNIVLAEEVLKEQFPLTWSYLIRNRDLLAARASLLKSGGKWYELVWPRDETWLRRPKLLIRDLAPRTSFALDQLGAAFLVGGTAVVPQQEEMLLPLLGYLNSNFVNNLVRRTTPQFRGDFQKFEPQHILQIPVLSRLIEDASFSAHVGELALNVAIARQREAEAAALEIEAEIDQLVQQAADEHGLSLDP